MSSKEDKKAEKARLAAEKKQEKKATKDRVKANKKDAAAAEKKAAKDAKKTGSAAATPEPSAVRKTRVKGAGQPATTASKARATAERRSSPPGATSQAATKQSQPTDWPTAHQAITAETAAAVESDLKDYLGSAEASLVRLSQRRRARMRAHTPLDSEGRPSIDPCLPPPQLQPDSSAEDLQLCFSWRAQSNGLARTVRVLLHDTGDPVSNVDRKLAGLLTTTHGYTVAELLPRFVLHDVVEVHPALLSRKLWLVSNPTADQSNTPVIGVVVAVHGRDCDLELEDKSRLTKVTGGIIVLPQEEAARQKGGAAPAWARDRQKLLHEEEEKRRKESAAQGNPVPPLSASPEDRFVQSRLLFKHDEAHEWLPASRHLDRDLPGEDACCVQLSRVDGTNHPDQPPWLLLPTAIAYTVRAPGVRVALCALAGSPSGARQRKCGTIVAIDAITGHATVRVDGTADDLAVLVQPSPATMALTKRIGLDKGTQLMLHTLTLDPRRGCGSTFVDAEVMSCHGLSAGNRHTVKLASGKIMPVDLNEMNHCVNVFGSVRRYDNARRQYLDQLRETRQDVEDAITGNRLRIRDQLLYIATDSTAAAVNADGAAAPETTDLWVSVAHDALPTLPDSTQLRYMGEQGRFQKSDCSILLDSSRVAVKMLSGRQIESKVPAIGLQLDDWNRVASIKDLALMLLRPNSRRHQGGITSQPVLLRAGPGSGKTWSVQQLLYLLADSTKKNVFDVGFVPMVMYVQKLACIIREDDGEQQAPNASWLLRYIEMEAKDGSLAAPVEGDPEQTQRRNQEVRAMLEQAFALRTLVLLIDGVDEAASLKGFVEDLVIEHLVPTGIQLVVTSRPEGVQLPLYTRDFVVMNLKKLEREQQQRAINMQLEENEFYKHLQAFSEIREGHDQLYTAVAFPEDADRHALEMAPEKDLFRTLDGTAHNPLMRQKDEHGLAYVEELSTGIGPRSIFLQQLVDAITDAKLKQVDTALVRLKPNASAVELVESLTSQGGLILDDEEDTTRKIIVKLALLVRKRALPPIRRASTLSAAKPASITAQALWPQIVARTDAMYVVAERYLPAFAAVLQALARKAGLDPATAVTVGNLKDPVRVHEKATDDYADRFTDGVLPEACVVDMIRGRIVCDDSAKFMRLFNTIDGFEYVLETFGPVRLQLLRSKNKFQKTDPSHFRNILYNVHMCFVGHEEHLPDDDKLRSEHESARHEWERADSIYRQQIMATPSNNVIGYQTFTETHEDAKQRWSLAQQRYQVGLTSGIRIFVEVQAHHGEILGFNEIKGAHNHYDFFRSLLAAEYESRLGVDLDYLLEERMRVFDQIAQVPVLLSMLIVAMGAHADDPAQVGSPLPADIYQLYSIATRAVLRRRFQNDKGKVRTGIEMLRAISNSNHGAQRRMFDLDDVKIALAHCTEQAQYMWQEMIHDEEAGIGGGLPLIKTLMLGGGQGEFQFKHISFQEAMFVDAIMASEVPSFWRDDKTAVRRLNDPYFNNSFVIGEGHLGDRLARSRPQWDLAAPAQQAGVMLDDAHGRVNLNRMLSKSTALLSLKLPLPGVRGSQANHERHHWASSPVLPCKLAEAFGGGSIALTWRDQGWGYQKGHIHGRRLVLEEDGTLQLAPGETWHRISSVVAPHQTTTATFPLPEDWFDGPGALLDCRGIELGYEVGGGGGHSLTVEPGGILSLHAGPETDTLVKAFVWVSQEQNYTAALKGDEQAIAKLLATSSPVWLAAAMSPTADNAPQLRDPDLTALAQFAPPDNTGEPSLWAALARSTVANDVVLELARKQAATLGAAALQAVLTPKHAVKAALLLDIEEIRALELSTDELLRVRADNSCTFVDMAMSANATALLLRLVEVQPKLEAELGRAVRVCMTAAPSQALRILHRYANLELVDAELKQELLTEQDEIWYGPMVGSSVTGFDKDRWFRVSKGLRLGRLTCNQAFELEFEIMVHGSNSASHSSILHCGRFSNERYPGLWLTKDLKMHVMVSQVFGGGSRSGNQIGFNQTSALEIDRAYKIKLLRERTRLSLWIDDDLFQSIETDVTTGPEFPQDNVPLYGSFRDYDVAQVSLRNVRLVAADDAPPTAHASPWLRMVTDDHCADLVAFLISTETEFKDTLPQLLAMFVEPSNCHKMARLLRNHGVPVSDAAVHKLLSPIEGAAEVGSRTKWEILLFSEEGAELMPALMGHPELRAAAMQDEVLMAALTAVFDGCPDIPSSAPTSALSSVAARLLKHGAVITPEAAQYLLSPSVSDTSATPLAKLVWDEKCTSLVGELLRCASDALALPITVAALNPDHVVTACPRLMEVGVSVDVLAPLLLSPIEGASEVGSRTAWEVLLFLETDIIELMPMLMKCPELRAAAMQDEVLMAALTPVLSSVAVRLLKHGAVITPEAVQYLLSPSAPDTSDSDSDGDDDSEKATPLANFVWDEKCASLVDTLLSGDLSESLLPGAMVAALDPDHISTAYPRLRGLGHNLDVRAIEQLLDGAASSLWRALVLDMALVHEVDVIMFDHAEKLAYPAIEALLGHPSPMMQARGLGMQVLLRPGPSAEADPSGLLLEQSSGAAGTLLFQEAALLADAVHLESEHPYEDSLEFEQVVAITGATTLYVAFHPKTRTERECDEVALYAAGTSSRDGKCLWRHSGKGDWPGQGSEPPLALSCDSFTWTFTTDSYAADWGYMAVVWQEQPVAAGRLRALLAEPRNSALIDRLSGVPSLAPAIATFHAYRDAHLASMLVPTLDEMSGDTIDCTPTLVVLAERCDDATIIAARTRLAQRKFADAAKASGEINIAFAIARPGDNLAAAVRRIANLPGQGPSMDVVLLNLRKDQYYGQANWNLKKLDGLLADFFSGQLKMAACHYE